MKKQGIRKTPLVFAAALLLMLGVAAKLTFSSSSGDTHYLTATAAVADLEEAVLASGALEAVKQVSVGAQATGQVKSLKVALGDQVKKGQLIAEIDSLTQQNELKTAEESLLNVQAQRRSKQATLRQAELAFARQQEMLTQDASSRQDFESAEATLSATRADIEALDAQIRQARVAVDTARVNLGYTRITAPMDGIVVAIVTKEGQTVNSVQQAPTIIKLAQLDTMTVKAQISEADVIRVRPGQKVYFTILGDPDHRYYATLRAIEPAPDSIKQDDTSTTSSTSSSSSSSSSSSAVYYNGLFDVPNEDGRLRISMTAEVSIVLAEAKGAVTVPVSALRDKDDQGVQSVLVMGSSGKPEERKVKVGLNNNVDAQIVEGLQAGEQVVIGESSGASTSDQQESKRHGPPPHPLGL